jgi:hypothetical protein
LKTEGNHEETKITKKDGENTKVFGLALAGGKREV